MLEIPKTEPVVITEGEFKVGSKFQCQYGHIWEVAGFNPRKRKYPIQCRFIKKSDRLSITSNKKNKIYNFSPALCGLPANFKLPVEEKKPLAKGEIVVTRKEGPEPGDVYWFHNGQPAGYSFEGKLPLPTGK